MSGKQPQTRRAWEHLQAQRQRAERIYQDWRTWRGLPDTAETRAQYHATMQPRRSRWLPHKVPLDVPGAEGRRLPWRLRRYWR